MKTTKQQKAEVLNSLPKKLQLEWNVILQCKDQRSLLKRLPYLFKALSLDHNYSNQIQLLQKEAAQRDYTYKQRREEAKIWLQEKLELLKSSPWAEHPTIYPKNKIVEHAIQGKFYSPFMGAIEHAWAQLKDAAFSVAAFGKDSLFDQWAQIEVFSFNRYPVQSFCFIPLNGCDKGRWKFAIDLQSGYVTYKISPCKEFIEMAQGHVNAFCLPECLEEILMHNRSQEDWKADCDSDVVTLYSYLNILAQYSLFKAGSIKPLILPIKPPPTSLEEADDHFANGCIVYFLSCFDSKKYSDRPVTVKELNDLIITFLTMLGSNACTESIKIGNKQKKSRDDARRRDAKTAKDWMKSQWEDWKISHSTMAAKLQLEIGRGQIKFERDYTLKTLERWAGQVDPWPKDQRMQRPKAKNLPPNQSGNS